MAEISLTNNFIFDCVSKKKSKTMGKNISVDSFTIRTNEKAIFQESPLTISYGEKYCLVGINGSGKSTLLKHIFERKFPIDSRMSIIYVEQEVEESNDSIVDTVLLGNAERFALVKSIRQIEEKMEESCNDTDMELYNQLQEELKNSGGYKDESIVKRILFGIGFEKDDFNKAVKTFSGGWRMRMSIAKALYMKPDYLLLDEPTNHLDMNACLWLTEYLTTYEKTLIVVSHNVQFISEICTRIISIENKKCVQYNTTYDNYRSMCHQNYVCKQEEWAKYKRSIKACKNKDDKAKIIKKYGDMQQPKDYIVQITFQPTYELQSPIIDACNIDFNYGNKIIFKDLNLNVDMDSRIAVLGKNGVGKTTLFKILCGIERPQYGTVTRNTNLRIGYYSQHFANTLPEDRNVTEYLVELYNTTKNNYINVKNLHEPSINPEQYVRAILGKIGLDGAHHKKLIGELSGGQKARVAFSTLFITRPHVLLLDEPSNHLDIETIDGLIAGLKEYDGGLVIITHNVYLIQQLHCSLYIIRNKTIEKYEGTLKDYTLDIMKEVNSI